MGIARFLPTFVALPLYTFCSFAQDTGQQARDYLQAQVDRHAFQGNVLLARDGQAIFEHSYGSAGPAGENSPSTRFLIASITKPVTAVAVLQQVERDRIHLDDAIGTYANVPPGWKSVTIRQLLANTSGIPDYTSLPAARREALQPKTVSDVIGMVRNLPLEFTPGTKFAYSNTGYLLLGVMLENILREPYPRLIQRNVLDPAGMTDSGYFRSRKLTPIATGYVGTPPNMEPAGVLNPLFPYSAGALFSTARDLLKFQTALAKGKLLHPETVTSMRGVRGQPYGLGWFVDQQGGSTRLWEGGDIDGFTGVMSWYPEQNVLVIVLGNRQTPTVRDIAANLADIALGNPVQTPKLAPTPHVRPDTLGRYIGTYQVTGGPTLRITREKGLLMIASGAEPRQPLTAESPKSFSSKAVAGSIEFETDTNNAIIGLVITTQDGPIRAARLP